MYVYDLDNKSSICIIQYHYFYQIHIINKLCIKYKSFLFSVFFTYAVPSADCIKIIIYTTSRTDGVDVSAWYHRSDNDSAIVDVHFTNVL